MTCAIHDRLITIASRLTALEPRTFRSPVKTLSQRASISKSPNMFSPTYPETEKPKFPRQVTYQDIPRGASLPTIVINTEYVVLMVMHLVIRIVNHLPHTASTKRFQSHLLRQRKRFPVTNLAHRASKSPARSHQFRNGKSRFTPKRKRWRPFLMSPHIAGDGRVSSAPSRTAVAPAPAQAPE